MKKAVKIVIALVVIGGAAGGGYAYWKTTKEKSQQVAPTTTTVKVSRGSIFQAVPSTGRVVSNLDVDIKCRASGQVVKLPFDVSQSVKKDELLLQLDPSEQQRTVTQREVDLAIAKAKRAQAEQNLLVATHSVTTARDRAESALASAEVRAKDALGRAERRRQLLAQNLGSQEDYDTAQTEAASAAADLSNARIAQEEVKTQELALEVKRQDVELAKNDETVGQLALDLANQQLSYTTVTAPIDGVVAAVNTQIGAIISSGITNVGGGTTIMTISDLSRVFLLAAVDESEIGKVAMEQPVDITLDAYPGKKFNGKVVRIATKGVNTSNVVTFEVKIEVMDDKKGLLKPEMTGNVQIIAAQKDDVLTVPMAAVSRKKGEGMVVTVVDDLGGTQEVPVKVGLNDGDKYQVVDGLKEGQSVQMKTGEAQSKWRADQARSMGMPGMGMPGMRPSGGGGRR